MTPNTIKDDSIISIECRKCGTVFQKRADEGASLCYGCHTGKCSGKHASVEDIIKCKDCAAFLDKMDYSKQKEETQKAISEHEQSMRAEQNPEMKAVYAGKIEAMKKLLATF